MAKVTELVTKFAFEGSTDPLARYNKELGASIKLIGGMVAATVAAGGVIAAWSHAVLQGVDALGTLSNQTGVAVGRIQELGFAASMTGSNASALNATLVTLSKNAGLAARGMGASREIFKELGVSVTDANGKIKNSADLLEDVRGRMNALNLSIDERRGLASRLGIDSTLIQYLMRTDTEMESLIGRARELGTLTQEQAEAAGAYNDSLTVMNFAMNAIKQQVAVGLAPAMTDLANKFTDLIAGNKDWIVSGIRATTEFIGNLLAMINRLLPILALLAGAFVAAKIAALGFAGVVAAIFTPVNIIMAIIVALALVVDDLIVAFKGGDSIIGNFFKNFLGIDLTKFYGWLTNIASTILNIGKYIAAITFDNFMRGLDAILGALSKVFGWVTKIGSALAGKIGRFLGMGKSNQDLAQLDGTGEVAGALPPDVTVGRAGGSSIAAGDTVDNRRVEQNVKIEVHSTDPIAAGNAAADGVQRQLRDANAQLGVGGM